MKFIVGVIAFVFSTALVGQGIQFFEGSWEEAVEEAVSKGKLVFVDAYTTWCGPCKMMSARVFTEEKVGDYFNENFINVKVDMEKPDGRKFGSKFPITAYPTLLFLNEKGQLVKKSVGAKQPIQLINLAMSVMNSFDFAKDYREQYEKGDRSFDVVYGYVEALNKSKKSSLKIANDYLLSDHGMTDEQQDLFIFAAMTDVDSKIFEMFTDRIETYNGIFDKETVDEKIAIACKNTIDKSIEYSAPSLYQGAIEAYIKYANDPDPLFVVNQQMDYAIQTKNADQYLDYSKEFFKVVEEEDDMYDWAGVTLKYFKDDNPVLDLGIKKMKKSAKKTNKFGHIVLYANLLYFSGELDEALEYLQDAAEKQDNETVKSEILKHSDRLKTL